MGRHYDLVDQTKKYKAELHEFFLDLRSWRKFKSKWKLEWQKVQFGESTRTSVPNERGIYVFTVELTPSKLPNHGYILYVGITGDNGNQNLKARYGQYLRQQKNEDGRPAVYLMLKNWAGDLYFNFASLPNQRADLSRIEKSFLNAVIPPVNRRDFDAKIASARAAKF